MDPWDFKSARDMDLHGMDRYRSCRRESGLATSLLRAGWWLFERAELRLWHRLEISGRENLPKTPPFVLVANHASHLDAPVLQAVLPFGWRDIVFPVAAMDVFFSKGGIATLGAIFENALPIRRMTARAHDMIDLRQRLTDPPSILIIFPEGTRTRDGSPLPFKPGIGRLVAGSPVPVVPCHISGAFESLPAGRSIPRPRKIRLKVGRPLGFAEVADDRKGWTQVAERIREAVFALDSGRAPCPKGSIGASRR